MPFLCSIRVPQSFPFHWMRLGSGGLLTRGAYIALQTVRRGFRLKGEARKPHPVCRASPRLRVFTGGFPYGGFAMPARPRSAAPFFFPVAVLCRPAAGTALA